LTSLPPACVIAGGGFVAAEFAHIFSALGVDVSLVNLGPRLLESFDPAISDRFTELARQRWDVPPVGHDHGVRRDGGRARRAGGVARRRHHGGRRPAAGRHRPPAGHR